jgi:hypothetical protein
VIALRRLYRRLTGLPSLVDRIAAYGWKGEAVTARWVCPNCGRSFTMAHNCAQPIVVTVPGGPRLG